jgi:hypothetical protein
MLKKLKKYHLGLCEEFCKKNEVEEVKRDMILNTVRNGSYNIIGFNEYNKNGKYLKETVLFSMNEDNIKSISYTSENKMGKLVYSFEFGGRTCFTLP